jgi:hypothetical protein
VQDALAVGGAQIEGESTLAAVVDDPRKVVRARRVARAAVAIGVAARRLDLDNVGAEVGHDRSGDGASDEAGRVDHTDAVEEAGHGPRAGG